MVGDGQIRDKQDKGAGTRLFHWLWPFKASLEVNFDRASARPGDAWGVGWLGIGADPPAQAPADSANNGAGIMPSLPPSANGNPAQIAPAGGLLGYSQGAAGDEVILATIAHIRGVRVNHLVGHGLVVGLQNTGDSSRRCSPSIPAQHPAP